MASLSGVGSLYIVATFEYSPEVELAISALEQQGIKKNRLQAVPLNQRAQEKKIFDSISHADGFGTVDAAFSLASVLMLFGTMYGFVWRGGPILWGLVGFVAGAVLGFGIDFYMGKAKHKQGRKNASIPEVCLIINCEPAQLQMVEDLLWDHFPLSVGRVENG